VGLRGKPAGWRYESARHSLASRGISSKSHALHGGVRYHSFPAFARKIGFFNSGEAPRAHQEEWRRYTEGEVVYGPKSKKTGRSEFVIEPSIFFEEGPRYSGAGWKDDPARKIFEDVIREEKEKNAGRVTVGVQTREQREKEFSDVLARRIDEDVEGVLRSKRVEDEDERWIRERERERARSAVDRDEEVHGNVAYKVV